MADWRHEARAAAARHGLDPDIFERQIQQESGFNPGARSPAGALGIAQIMPDTARGWGVDPMDPHAALDAAAKNMARYVRQYGSYRNALIAYNAGPGAVGNAHLPAETSHYIDVILGGHGEPDHATTPSPKTYLKTTSTRRLPGLPAMSVPVTQETTDKKGALLNALMTHGDRPLLDTVMHNLQSGAFTSTTTKNLTSPAIPGDEQKVLGTITNGGLPSVEARANLIDSQHRKYLYGGGHGGVDIHNGGQPIDCSAAVSAALGVDVRVSGAFESFGDAGPGQHITIYAKGTHVLMEINGHFWGTSHSNPGGGAGWIPRGAISKQYLAGFVARHPHGL